MRLNTPCIQNDFLTTNIVRMKRQKYNADFPNTYIYKWNANHNYHRSILCYLHEQIMVYPVEKERKKGRERVVRLGTHVICQVDICFSLHPFQNVITFIENIYIAAAVLVDTLNRMLMINYLFAYKVSR